MRIATIILSLMIFIASSNVGSAMKSMSQAFGSTCATTCHVEDVEEEPKGCSDHDEEEGCCKDNCPCTCCIHIVFYKNLDQKVTVEDYYFNASHSWNFNYSKQHLHAVFHPPLA